MSGRVPTWIADWIGASAASGVDAATWQLDSSWRWTPWATVLLAIAATAWIVFLYARESTAASPRYRAVLAGLRLIVIAVVLVMIAQWALALRLTGPPAIAVLVDRSASMATVDRYSDAQKMRQINERLAERGLKEPTRINLAKLLLTGQGGLIQELAGRYRLQVYWVDGAVERITSSEAIEIDEQLSALSATGPNREKTRLGDAVRQVLHDFRGSEPATIILVTDGVTTEGISLVAAADEARRAGVPLMTIGLGQREPPQDIELADVLVDDVVFVNDVVSFQIQVKASGLDGQPAKILLRRLAAADSGGASTNVAEESIRLPPTGQTMKTRLVDRPSEPGEITYEVELQPREEETNRENNRARRMVTVRDEKIRVLLVQAYPSYEFRFLKSLLERDETVKLSTYLQDADAAFAEQDKTALRSFPLDRQQLFEYDVLLFGDVDPRLLPPSAWRNVRAFVVEKGGGAAFLAGPQFFPSLCADNSDVSALLPFEPLAASPQSAGGLKNDVTLKSGLTVEPTPIGLVNPAMQLGDLPSATEQIWQRLSPLYWFYEVQKTKPAAQIFAVVKSARSTSSPTAGPLPVILFQYVGPGRVLFHAIDSTWRWRLGAREEYFARYWVQTIRFLARGKLATSHGAQLVADRREYLHGDSVQLRARFFNPQLAPAGDIVTVLTSSPGQARRRTSLQRNFAAAGIFEGSLVDLSEGEYEAVMVEPQVPGNSPSARFDVVSPPDDLTRLEMDAPALRGAAEATGGKFYTIENVNRLANEVPAGRRTPLDNLPSVPLWNRWWLLAIFLACITSEWILRKRKGML
jgi:hypothetical protein